MLITGDYFSNEILIPNLTGYNQAIVDGNNDELNRFIAIHEPGYLISMLGRTLYDLFVIDLAKTSNREQRFIDLEAELVNEEYKISPIANYIYYWWKRARVTEQMGVGEVQPLVENATLATNSSRMVEAWNNMVIWSQQVWDWLEENESDFPEFDYSRSMPFVKINSFGL